MGSISPPEPGLKPHPFKKVLIVGAGPASLLLALLLAQHSIPVSVLEAWSGLDSGLRATQYGTPASRIFRKAGVLDDIRAAGIPSFKGIYWRTVKDGKKVASVDLTLTQSYSDRITVLPLGEILQILYRHCKKWNVEVRFKHRVVSVRQDAEQARVEVEVGLENGADCRKETFDADYVIGCDGATSCARQELFGRQWPGITWEHALMVQNVFYDGFAKHGWSGGNYMIDPEHWGLIAERKTGLWRVTYRDIAGLENDEYLKRRAWHFEAMLPGRPKVGEYTVEETAQFRIHNRCVETMRVGRVLLAADAAHVCNPFGGYGAMAGILDVGALADYLIEHYDGRAGEEILDLYAKIRREKFLDYVDRRSIKNMKRLNQLDPERVLEVDKFLQMLIDLEKDPERMKEFLLKHSSIEHDFTQYYTS